jgi:hypothetical protein
MRMALNKIPIVQIKPAVRLVMSHQSLLLARPTVRLSTCSHKKANLETISPQPQIPQISISSSHSSVHNCPPSYEPAIPVLTMGSTSAAPLLGYVEPRDTLDAWEMAKARFLEGLDDKEKTTFNEATAENMFYQASNLQRDDNRDSKTRTLLETMQPLIAAVNDYGKAMDTFANISSLCLAPIWGSIRVVLVIASSYGRFYIRMVDTFGRIGDIIPRLRKCIQLYTHGLH